MPLQRPPLRHTYTMTRARRTSALGCQRRMHRTTWELLSGKACALGTLGANTPACAMRRRCRTASAPPLHRHARRQTWWVRLSTQRAKTSGLGSVRRRLCAGACGSRHMGCVGGPAHQLAIHTSGGLQTSVTPRRVNTFGPQWSDRLTLLRRRRLCTRLCPCVRCIWSGIIVLTFGVTAVAAAYNLCHDPVFPSCPDFGSAPRAHAAREHRWRHIEHLLFECQCIPGLDGSVALALLRDDLFRVCSGSDHTGAVLLAAFPTSRIPVVAATACVVPFLLDPAVALSRMPLGT